VKLVDEIPELTRFVSSLVDELIDLLKVSVDLLKAGVQLGDFVVMLLPALSILFVAVKISQIL